MSSKMNIYKTIFLLLTSLGLANVACAAEFGHLLSGIEKGCSFDSPYARNISAWIEFNQKDLNIKPRVNKKQIQKMFSIDDPKIASNVHLDGGTVTVSLQGNAIWQLPVNEIDMSAYLSGLETIKIVFDVSASELRAALDKEKKILNGSKSIPRAKISELKGKAVITCKFGEGSLGEGRDESIGDGNVTKGWSQAFAANSDKTNIRSAPSVQASVVTQVGPGSTLEVRPNANSDWYEVGKTGSLKVSGFVRKDRVTLNN
jgi:Bacterial SH3 domain